MSTYRPPQEVVQSWFQSNDPVLFTLFQTFQEGYLSALEIGICGEHKFVLKKSMPSHPVAHLFDIFHIHERECTFYKSFPSLLTKTKIPSYYDSSVQTKRTGWIALEYIENPITISLAKGLNEQQMKQVLECLAEIHMTGFTHAELMKQTFGPIPDNDEQILIAMVPEGWKTLHRLVPNLISFPYTSCKYLRNDFLVHGDCWVNNILFVDGKCCLLDFQWCGFGNGLEDVLFLLYSSLQSDLFPKIDNLLQFYRQFVNYSNEDWDHDIKEAKKAAMYKLVVSADVFLKHEGQSEVLQRIQLAYQHVLNK